MRLIITISLFFVFAAKLLVAQTPMFLKDIKPNGNAYPGNYVEEGGFLYFTAYTATGANIYRTDGNLFEHTAPAPYNNTTGLFIETNKAYPSTGLTSLVEVNNKLIFNCRAQHNNLLSLDISGTPTFPAVLGPTSGTGFAPYPFNGKAYLHSGGDLISSDGNTITVELTESGPYFFREFQGRLYFSGETTAGGSTNILHSIDNTGAIRIFNNIPVFGGTTVFNRQNRDYSLTVLDGKLHAFINDYPQQSVPFGIHEIDVTTPDSPVAIFKFADVPKEMFNFELINGFYYYWFLPFNTANQQLKKHNGTTGHVIAADVGDSSFTNFKYWDNDLYFTGKLEQSQFHTCENFSTGYIPGYEWYKLSSSQLDCQANRTASSAFFLKDDVLASTTDISLNTPILLNSNTCHILDSPSISLNSTLQVNLPAVLVTDNNGCQ